MKKNIIKVLVVIILLMIAIAILKIAPNYIRDEIKNKVNLVINNSNVTASLKNDIYIDENDVIYLSKEDIDNFFDEYVYYDKKYNQIITTSENKIATLEVENTTIYINGEEQNIKSSVIEKNDRYFIPISELKEVYNISVEYVEKTDRVVIESLNREQKKTECIKDNSIKYKTTIFSKTVDKVKKGESVVVVSEMDNWLKVRTDNGILGYMKKNDAKDVTVSRTEKKKEKQIDGKVSLVWDYFSEYGSAPDRAGTRINGINVVSPTFFTLTDEGRGKIDVNVGNEGIEYIKWAHSNGYKVWPSISNNSYIQTTSDIMNDYKLRQILIENIVNLIEKYNLDGINIDFEYMVIAHSKKFISKDESYKIIDKHKIAIDKYINQIRIYLNNPITIENILKHIIVNNNLSHSYKEYHFFKSSLISLISYLIDLGEVDYILKDGELLYYTKNK